MLEALALAIGGYPIGSVSSAILVCRLLRLPDPRSQGSGNPGATNVLRIGGRLAGGLALAGDFLKGTLPVLIALGFGAGEIAVALAGLGAYLGHVYPVFFGFRGGKGVATGLGVVLGWSWLALVAMAGTWLAVAALTRISSLAALTAFLLAPSYLWFLTGNAALVAAMAVMAAITWWRHRGNIRRLVDGTEARIGATRR